MAAYWVVSMAVLTVDSMVETKANGTVGGKVLVKAARRVSSLAAKWVQTTVEE